MSIIKAIQDFHELSNNVTDKRVANWAFVSSPFPTLSIVGLYLFVACFAGPKLMKAREAVSCRLFLPFYNFALVVLNYYIFQEVIAGSSGANYSYVCTPLRRNSMDHNEMKVTKAIWWYYISKHIELFDTVFFILRKQNRLITFLHVYHHATMPLLWWVGVKWVPGGQSFFIVLINSGIHIVMYVYYGLAAIGPKMRKYLWWKKYLTILQLLNVMDILCGCIGWFWHIAHLFFFCLAIFITMLTYQLLQEKKTVESTELEKNNC